jgi:hypothetical protein
LGDILPNDTGDGVVADEHCSSLVVWACWKNPVFPLSDIAITQLLLLNRRTQAAFGIGEYTAAGGGDH